MRPGIFRNRLRSNEPLQIDNLIDNREEKKILESFRIHLINETEVFKRRLFYVLDQKTFSIQLCTYKL